jgi:hypothetical protein
MALELFGDLLQLVVQGADHPDQGRDGRAVGLGDHPGGLQLRLAQDGLQLGGAAVHAALTTGSTQGRGQLGPRQLAAQGRGRGHAEHGQGVAAAQVATDGGQRPGVELPQQAAQLVELALAGPDQALVGPGQDLDRLGQGAVAGDWAVVVAVGPDQVGQDLGISSIGLGPEV